MITILPNTSVSPLRQKLIDDMTMRHFSVATQRNYIRDVGCFASVLRPPPDTATTEDVRQFQLAQSQAGVPVPTMNSVVRRCGSSLPIPLTDPIWLASWCG